MKANQQNHASPLKIYRGYRSPDGRCNVTVSDAKTGQRPLSLRLDLRIHSPTGFDGGYSGSGSAQLALALLADACGETETALHHYQEFKQEVVVGLDTLWTLTDRDIWRFVESRRNGT